MSQLSQPSRKLLRRDFFSYVIIFINFDFHRLKRFGMEQFKLFIYSLSIGLNHTAAMLSPEGLKTFVFAQ